MIIYLFLAALLGVLAGFVLATWLGDLPTLPSNHELCDERYERMRAKLSAQISEKEKELQRLIAGMS